jgi:transposase InsO family protein
MEENSLGGKRYFVIFKDDYSKYTYVYFINKKSEVKEKFELFLNTVKNQLNSSVNTLRSDCGLEYKNAEVKAILDKFGIKHETSVPYTPQQNGKAERSMRTIVEAARTMLYSKNLPKNLWAEAVNTVVYVLNLTGNSGHEGKTPYELWYNKMPNKPFIIIWE